MAPRSPNERLTWELIDRWNQGDHQSILEVVDPDTELHSRLGELRGAPYVGPDGFREWLRDIEEQFSAFQIRIDDLEEVEPDKIVAKGAIEFRGRESDLPWAQETLWIFDLADGRLRRFQVFTDLEKGLKAAGEL
jgi:ketosteroid isomerase-like protein